ncbi:MAG: L-histidine N(alpha)-methyltransferase [Deltaproteobacteria bacterium]|nr:L-histidine N(alpha)-methyltransferase [Deltaproteobacteria bacterium]
MTTPAIPLHDLHPAPDDFLGEVLAGLQAQPKTLPCKYFYDARGSEIFDRICELEEYYPTRTEVGILERYGDEIADRLGADCALIEFGSGSSLKTRLLLLALERPAAYLPIDISRDHLMSAAEHIAKRFPGLVVRPICADFAGTLSLPELPDTVRSKVVFFPGSTIGNFAPEPRLALLRRIAAVCAPKGGSLLIGIDLQKDVATLERAYNDARGVTRDFNLNLLERIKRELNADIDVSAFEHRALYSAREERIEMHLVSRLAQRIQLADASIDFRAGESVRTECSYKFAIPGFADLAARAGFELESVWSDELDHFAVLLLRTG